MPEDYREFKSACGPLLPPVEVPPVIPPLPQALEPGGETTPGRFSDVSNGIKCWSVRFLLLCVYPRCKGV